MTDRKQDDRNDDRSADRKDGDRGGSAANQPNPIALQKALKGVDYPAGRDTLCSTAKDNGADDDILEALGRIDDRDYEDPAQVSEAVWRAKG